MENPSLFERLGGSSGIAAMVDDIVAAHMVNPVIRARFQPYLDTPDRLAATKAQLRAFLEAGSGGPQQYAGRSMREAHRGMNISAGEYMAAIDDILAVLRRRGIDAQAQQEILSALYSMKDDILHV